MYYLHESSCHFQFMRELSIQGTGLAGVWSQQKMFAMKGSSQTPPPQQRPVLFLTEVHDTIKQSECTCVHLVTDFSCENTRCVMTKCSCVSAPNLMFFSTVLIHPAAQQPLHIILSLFLTYAEHQMGGSHSSSQIKYCLLKFRKLNSLQTFSSRCSLL